LIKILLFRKELTSGTTWGEKEGEERREEEVELGEVGASDLKFSSTS
jgi:hypothetical protein